VLWGSWRAIAQCDGSRNPLHCERYRSVAVSCSQSLESCEAVSRDRRLRVEVFDLAAGAHLQRQRHLASDVLANNVRVLYRNVKQGSCCTGWCALPLLPPLKGTNRYANERRKFSLR
jgi:hypothetical protein